MKAPRIFRDNPVPFIIMFLVAVTAVAYWRVLGNDFTNFDDDVYILKNFWVRQGLTFDSIRWAFSFSGKEGTYWHPLTWLSLMLDHDLFRLDPAGYHLVNLLLHIANAVILFITLNRMTGKPWQSAFVAFLFALHPLNVESVAWAVERKSVLSSFFWMLALYAWLRYAETPSWRRYLAVFTCLAIGLMAKSMLVTLPFALLLLDYWPLGRLKPAGSSVVADEKRLTTGRLVLEKLPLFALSLASVAISIWSVNVSGRGLSPAAGIVDKSTFADRVINALVSYVVYLGDMIWPAKLAVYYPLVDSYPAWQPVGAAVLLIGATLAAFVMARKRPWLLTGWLWYLGVLFPVCGLMRAGLWPAMADRFTYLPCIGVFIIIAWGVPELLRSMPHRRTILATASLAVIAALSTQTWTQTGYWKTSQTLFAHALEATPDNYVARDNYGNALFYQGRTEESMEQFRAALRFNPGYAKAHFNLGAALDALGRTDEAIAHYRDAIRIYPRLAEAHNALGLALLDKGKYEEAAIQITESISLDPRDPGYYFNLGLVLVKAKKWDEAGRQFAQALRLKPDFTKARYYMGNVLVSKGEFQEAIDQYNEVLRIDPKNAEARNNLGFARQELARKEKRQGPGQTGT